MTSNTISNTKDLTTLVGKTTTNSSSSKRKMFFTDFLDDPEEFNYIMNSRLNSNSKNSLRNLKELTPPFSEYMNRSEEIKNLLFPNNEYSDNNGLWLTPWLDSAFKNIVSGNIEKGVTEALELRKISPIFYDEYMVELFKRTGFLTNDTAGVITKIKEYQATLPEKDDRINICETAINFIEKPSSSPLSLTNYTNSFLDLTKLNPGEKKMLVSRTGFATSIIDVKKSNCDIDTFFETLIQIGYGSLPTLVSHWMAQSFKNISEGNIAKGAEEAKLISQTDSKFFRNNIFSLNQLYKELPNEVHEQVTKYVTEHPLDKEIISMLTGSKVATKVTLAPKISTISNNVTVNESDKTVKDLEPGQKSEAAKEILSNFFDYAYNDQDRKRGLKNMMLLEKHYKAIFDKLMTQKQDEIANKAKTEIEMAQFEQRYFKERTNG